MNDLSEILDALEEKTIVLINRLEELKKENRTLKKEVSALRNKNQSSTISLEQWEEKYKSLKMAGSLLGSNEDKTEAKLKINSLIRDLDHCIAQLAE